MLVSLNGTNSHVQGRVQVTKFRSFIYGAVRSNTWNINHAHVVCSQKFSSHGLHAYVKESPPQERVDLDNLQCYGNEQVLNDCASSMFGVDTMSTHADVAVHCYDGKSVVTIIKILKPSTIFWAYSLSNGNQILHAYGSIQHRPRP